MPGRDAITPEPDPGLPAWAPASLGRRFVALLIDWILCLLASGIFADPRTDPWAPVVVLIGVYGFFLGLFGQSPGMFLMGLRCVSVVDGQPVGIPRALLRGLLLAGVIPALIMDEQRRGLHDRAAGSIMITANPPPPPSSIKG